ncbi:MAG: dimethylmenaquinone methyltransferase [Sphingobacteriales bacterium 17-39-43]|uniref:RraA family protein n=1 Tax=Daejeonella sp. TaxID=2805397 RepID=UPI000BCF1F18|nr:RraA family protein [Daejeonella sp.]OYZ33100.1 MAG: dimethylmenaquinone methyltransferase [Sphingobacteriales bacterium 16-39-50]OZA26509.1 MAG: dimethylmenaquinone methyltransferase [Sphingobacteriales bacterium 17-39-43]HQS51840.1 RraA family protein [Daejeonella sp.]HQT21656.1 RraA family protein [Daejeonella sp.]HQT56387.1 RraA family protein [Daejeonella sp.]
MCKKLILLLLILQNAVFVSAQRIGSSPEYVKELTALWKGERSADGRPKVSELVLDRLQYNTLEQIWGYLLGKGYRNQVEKNWTVLKTGQTMVGSVVTAQFMPSRPDLDTLIKAQGRREGRSQRGGYNIWPIDILTKGDVYVADGFGKVKDGTLIGSSLGNSIYAKTGKGVVFNGSIRDMQELRDTEGFNAWVKGHDPSFIRDMTPTSINAPIRVGEVTVFPGDIVFANDYGVVFIPAHLVEDLVKANELTGLRDEFERLLLKQGKYLSGEIHGDWTEVIKNEFRAWLAKYPRKTMYTPEQLDTYLGKKH